MNDFIVIAITPPVPYPDEAGRIENILSSDLAHFVHIRKPNYSEDDVESLIKEIKPEFHHRLKLHDHFELLDKYDLGGVHLNSRNRSTHPKSKSVSISLHSLEEIEDAESYDYFFISPVFDSISKEGYMARFDHAKLSKAVKGKKAIALGGVTPEKFDYLKSLGFKGAALLGHFFPSLPAHLKPKKH
ncbi:MAG: thiamine phosphate synthase [Muribaculaceae bacterium]|nr:thiamine phosphate synthase [Muribaculaceae bacterium]